MSASHPCPFCSAAEVVNNVCQKCGTSSAQPAKKKPDLHDRHRRSVHQFDADANGGWSQVPRAYEDK